MRDGVNAAGSLDHRARIAVRWASEVIERALTSVRRSERRRRLRPDSEDVALSQQIASSGGAAQPSVEVDLQLGVVRIPSVVSLVGGE